MPTLVGNLSPAARQYLDAALDIMQANTIARNVDWTAWRMEAYRRADGAQTPTDTYLAVQKALDQLGDHHSMFYTPERAARLKKLTVADNPPPKYELLGSQLAYLLVPGFVTSDDNQRHLYADQLQALIQKADAAKPCGWVIDLRQNTGGNIWPMFAGWGLYWAMETCGRLSIRPGRPWIGAMWKVRRGWGNT